MKIPESWLRAYVNPQWTTRQLEDALTMAGLEVEESAPYAPAFDKVVVAEVKSVQRHPNADKLTVCEVDTGSGLSTIVCGAPNVAVGVRVPCALPGATLPGGLQIKPVTMRGVQSTGMLCSARELGLSEDHSGLLLLPADAPVGQDIRQYLDLDDRVMLLKLTPNRADCLSVFGVAREVAAISGATLRAPEFHPAPVTLTEKLPVRISAPDLCGRFSGRIIRGVNAHARTPDWIRQRLERAGQRSISALVDLSNYVMLELGRPSHVFDLDKIHGGLDVRWARKGESLALLNGQTVALDESVGVIADEHEVESLAGIMGGESTAVSLDTRNVYVEAAFWWPVAIAGRARHFNFSTDAGYRFERGVDGESTVDHLEYLTGLILQVCGGQAGPVDDTLVALPERKPVTMRTARARKVIGVEIADDEMAEVFKRLGLGFEQQTDRFVVQPPSFRFDLEIEEDLIEEVARLWGFERLPIRPPRVRAPMQQVPGGQRPLLTLKRALVDRDYQEVINFSFVSGDLDQRLTSKTAIKLLNPIAAHLDVMRTTLLGGLLENLRYNLNRKLTRVRLLEVGRIFGADATQQAGPLSVKGVFQPWRLGLLAYGPAVEEQWGVATRLVDYFDVKGDLQALLGVLPVRWEPLVHPALHPGRSAQLSMGEQVIGWLGELHPAVQQHLELAQPPIVAELDLDVLLAREPVVFQEVSKFPPAIRDMAFVVPDVVSAQQMLETIGRYVANDAAARVVRNVRLFDEYRGKGLENKEKSLAFRFWMQDTDKTLSDAEVAAVTSQIAAHVGSTLGARLRG